MTDSEQKRIISKNLEHYIAVSHKKQKEIASDLGILPSTFNTWVKGKRLPPVSMVQKLALYFGILTSDILDDKLDTYNARVEARILNDSRTLKMIEAFYSLDMSDQITVANIIYSLADKVTREDEEILK